MSRIQSLAAVLLGPRAQDLVGRVTIWAALLGFILHLFLWAMVAGGVWSVGRDTVLLKSPLLALYTPFSILLAYEVYQLIRAIPESFSASIGKQFEVVTLIVVRESLVYLADLSARDLDSLGAWVLPLLVKTGAFIMLLTVSLAIAREGERRPQRVPDSAGMRRYVVIKQGLSVALLGLFAIIASGSVVSWCLDAYSGDEQVNSSVFFGDFFTILVLVDIFILLMSYQYTSRFSILARNTGFVFSTVIMRIGLEAPAYADAILFSLAAVVGFLVLWITNRLDPDHRHPGERT